MIKKQTLFFMGPVSPPYTGQAVAFTTILNYYKNSSDFDVIELNTSNVNRVSSGILLCFKIFGLIIFNKIDLIYFTCSRSFFGSIRDIVLLFCARLFRIKIINHLHGADFAGFYENSGFIYKQLLNFSYKGIDTSIVLLNEMRNQFESFPLMNIEIVPNSYSASLDTYPFSISREKKSVLRFLYLSNIIESKGILLVLSAFDELLKKYENIYLSIAGLPVGDEYASKDLIEKKFFYQLDSLNKKYKNKVDYKGVISGKKKNDLLWDSDVFVLPSFYKTEAFPISILEAMRAGNYIISTNHNYIPNILSSNNGALVEPRSVESLIDAMENIIIDTDKLINIQNYNIDEVINKYSESKYIQSITNILNENLNNNSYI